MGVKKNFIYSSILTVSNYLFPLLTYPYVSRVLGVTNIGICNFIDSIINYFILFSMMGVSILGIREIAGTVTDKDRRSKVFSGLFLLNSITTLIMLFLLLLSLHLIPELSEHKDLMYVGAAKLVANLFLVEWYFKGIENFKYITNRTIIVKCIYVFSVFLFVKESTDYPIYFFLLCMMVIVNAFINFPYACTQIKLTFKNAIISPYIKPFLVMGFYLLLTSMYTSFNVAYLGFTSNEIQVGYYTTATKLFTIILAIFTSFTNVMLPRMSALYAKGDIVEFKRLIDKSLSILFSLTVPVILFAMMYTREIIDLICGVGYEGAYIPTFIIMPLMFIIGYEQILIVQVLMPAKQDKIVFRNSVFGAITGIVFNVILVKWMQSSGSAITWLFSEIVVLISAQYGVKRLLGLRFPWKQLFLKVLMYLPILPINILILSSINNIYIKLLIGGGIMVLYALAVLIFVEKNSIILNLLNKIRCPMRLH